MPLEPLLQAANNRVAETGREPVRTVEGQNVVPNTVGASVPLDQELLLAAFDVARKRNRYEPEPADRPRIIQDINDPTCVEPPDTEGQAATQPRWNCSLRRKAAIADRYTGSPSPSKMGSNHDGPGGRCLGGGADRFLGKGQFHLHRQASTNHRATRHNWPNRGIDQGFREGS
jgi:hypothetical protein